MRHVRIRGNLNMSAAIEGIGLMQMPVRHMRERRRRDRVPLRPMYTSVAIRVLQERSEPCEGHILNISESGMAVEIDRNIEVGAAVTVEFSVAGMGRLNREQWPLFVTTAEVTRSAQQQDFPNGPYVVGLRYLRITTMTQAQITRYILAAPETIR